tara:strand:- start:2594 stop:2851 length:258 start_codon:yes stop_codon:yes gene_type:complete
MKSRKEIIKYETLKHFIKQNSTAIKKVLEKDTLKTIWVSKKKAAQLYDVSERTIDNWRKDGKIRSKLFNDKPYCSISPLLDSSEE